MDEGQKETAIHLMVLHSVNNSLVLIRLNRERQKKHTLDSIKERKESMKISKPK